MQIIWLFYCFGILSKYPNEFHADVYGPNFPLFVCSAPHLYFSVCSLHSITKTQHPLDLRRWTRLLNARTGAKLTCLAKHFRIKPQV